MIASRALSVSRRRLRWDLEWSMILFRKCNRSLECLAHLLHWVLKVATFFALFLFLLLDYVAAFDWRGRFLARSWCQVVLALAQSIIKDKHILLLDQRISVYSLWWLSSLVGLIKVKDLVRLLLLRIYGTGQRYPHGCSRVRLALHFNLPSKEFCQLFTEKEA